MISQPAWDPNMLQVWPHDLMCQERKIFHGGVKSQLGPGLANMASGQKSGLECPECSPPPFLSLQLLPSYCRRAPLPPPPPPQVSSKQNRRKIWVGRLLERQHFVPWLMRDGGGKFVGLGAVAVARDCRAGAVTIALSLPSTAVGLDGSCFPLICSQEHLIEHFNTSTDLQPGALILTILLFRSTALNWILQLWEQEVALTVFRMILPYHLQLFNNFH